MEPDAERANDRQRDRIGGVAARRRDAAPSAARYGYGAAAGALSRPARPGRRDHRAVLTGVWQYEAAYGFRYGLRSHPSLSRYPRRAAIRQTRAARTFLRRLACGGRGRGGPPPPAE